MMFGSPDRVIINSRSRVSLGRTDKTSIFVGLAYNLIIISMFGMIFNTYVVLTLCALVIVITLFDVFSALRKPGGTIIMASPAFLRSAGELPVGVTADLFRVICVNTVLTLTVLPLAVHFMFRISSEEVQSKIVKAFGFLQKSNNNCLVVEHEYICHVAPVFLFCFFALLIVSYYFSRKYMLAERAPQAMIRSVLGKKLTVAYLILIIPINAMYIFGIQIYLNDPTLEPAFIKKTITGSTAWIFMASILGFWLFTSQTQNFHQVWVRPRVVIAKNK